MSGSNALGATPETPGVITKSATPAPATPSTSRLHTSPRMALFSEDDEEEAIQPKSAFAIFQNQINRSISEFGSAVKKSFLNSEEQNNELSHSFRQTLPLNHQEQPLRKNVYLLILAFIVGLFCLVATLDHLLPEASEYPKTAKVTAASGDGARWALLSIPDLFWMFGGQNEEQDIIKKMARYGESPSSSNNPDLHLDRLVEALVSSPKFEAFIAEASSKSNQEAAKRLQGLLNTYEDDMVRRLDSVKRLNQIDRDKFKADFDHFKLDFEDQLRDLETKKLSGLQKKVEDLTSSSCDLNQRLLKTMANLQGEISATQQQIHDVSKAAAANADEESENYGKTGEVLRTQLGELDARLSKLGSDFSELSASVEGCNKRTIDTTEISENLAKKLTLAFSQGQDALSGYPEAQKLAAELKNRFVMASSSGSGDGESGDLQSQIDAASEAMRTQIMSQIRTEVLSSSSLEDQVRKLVRDQQEQLQVTAAGNFKAQFSEEELARIVNERLVTYDADKTGQFDFALESSGGTIETTRCTRNYDKASAVYTVMGVPIWSEGTDPRMILRPGTQPGQCWGFSGSQGTVVIRLSSVIRVTGVTLEHIPALLSPDGHIASAPKNFAVYGLHDAANSDKKKLLGNFTYTEEGSPIQTFATDVLDESFPLVEVQIQSNQGNPDYTCLYRVRVHGNLK